MMDSNGMFLWTLSMKKQKCDVLSPTTKAIALAWWILETMVSLDKGK
jgi:hypothetical protein